MIKALDTACRDFGLGGAPFCRKARRGPIALEETRRGRPAAMRPSAPKSIPSRSASKAKCVSCVSMLRMTKGFGLVNPLSVRKQIEGQIVWFYNDAMYQECNVTEGRNCGEQL